MLYAYNMSKEKTTGAPAPAPIAPAAPKPGGAPLAPMGPMPPKPPLPSAPKEKQAPLPNASNPGPPAAPPPIGKILKKPKKNLSQAGSHASKTGAPKARYRAQPKPKQTAPMASSGMGFLDAIKQKRKKEVKFPKYIPLSNYYQAYLNTNSNINEDEKKSENVSNNKAGVDGINWPMLDEDSDYIRVIALSDTHMGHWKLDPLFPKDGKPNPKDFIAKKGKKKKKKTKGKKVIQNNDVNAAIANNQQTIATEKEKEKEKEKVENVAKQTEEATTNKEKCGKMLKKILVVSGDFTNDGDLSEAKEFFEWIVNVKEKYKFDKILLTFGNHEGYSRGFANGILFKDPNSTKTTAIATNDTDSKNSTNNCNDDSSSGIRNESKNNDSSVGEIYNIDTSKINDDPYMLATARNQEYFIDSIEYFKEKVMKMKDLHFLHDESIVINGIKFYGSPWCPHLEYSVGNERKNPKYTKLFDAGFHVTAEVLRKQWKKIPYDTNYLITHTPPMGILDINKYGCYDLRMELTRLKNLQIHQFGHVHNGYGFEFVFKNDLIEKNNKALDIMQHEWKLLNKKQMMLTDQLMYVLIFD